MKAGETIAWVLLVVFERLSTSVLSRENRSFCDCLFFVSDCNCLAVVDPLQERWSVKLHFQVVVWNFSNLGGAKISIEELLHLNSDVLVFRFDSVALFKSNELFVKVSCFKDLYVIELRLAQVFRSLIVPVLLVFPLLNSPRAQTVCSVGHQDQHKEAAKSHVGFPLFHNSVDQDDVEPNVGDDGPNSCNGEDTCV